MGLRADDCGSTEHRSEPVKETFRTVPRHNPAMLTRVATLALVVASCLCVACGTDNSITFVEQVGGAASRLRSGEAGSSLTVPFNPTAPASPYTVIFFPDRDVGEPELVAAGVDKATAHMIYTEMAYLGSFAGAVVVAQEGERLNFTTSWKQVAGVQAPEHLVVSQRKTGPAEIELRRHDGVIRVTAIR
jgi:hypothetical protein